MQLLHLWDIENASYTKMWLTSSVARLVPRHYVSFREGVPMNEVDDLYNLERYPDYIAHSPGAGWRGLIHYGQIIRDGPFQRFDWGDEENMKRYN